MNQTVDERDYYAPYIAVIAAISADKGVDLIMMFDKAVSRFEFVEFLYEIRKQNSDATINMFLDNLTAHKTNEVTVACEELAIKTIFNVPYRYDF